MPSLELENSIVDDRYEVRRRLNHGSYAEIFEAFDLMRGRRAVIIKALNTALQGTPEEDLERTLIENFQNEAIALDRVSHPNVVRRLGHGTAADLAGTPFHYLVLEYMSGGDLMALCRRGPLALPQMLFYARQICEALDEAHERGIIHRDVKPNNLLLSANHEIIKIIDFGVAKLGGADPTAEVTRVGTDLYAPPEHNPNSEDGGVRERLTPSADVYSLAKTIYAVMTGKAPRQFARRPITELPAELAHQPWGGRLLAILRRATADAVADRYPSVKAFWADLSALGATAPEEDEEDELTHIRRREGLREAAPLPPVAPAPDFKPQHHLEGERPPAVAPRIVVDMGEKAGPPAPKAPAKPPKAPPPGDQYSYGEDLKDLVGTGWRLRAAVAAGVLLLCGSVAGVYYEVQRRITTSAAKMGTVKAQRLKMRDRPAMSSRELGELPNNTRVRILSRDETGSWYEVEVVEWGAPVDNEQVDRGWVGSRHVDVDGT
jgi:serine/threonine protein kinase